MAPSLRFPATLPQSKISSPIKQSNIFKTSLRAVPDGMLIVDDDLDWVSWNDRLFEILQLNKELIVRADSPAKAT